MNSKKQRRKTDRAAYVRHDDHDHPKTSWWYKKCRAYMQEHDGQPRVATEQEWEEFRASGTKEVSTQSKPPVPNKATLDALAESGMEREARASTALDGDTHSLDEPEVNEEPEGQPKEEPEEEPEHKQPVVRIPEGSLGIGPLRQLIESLETIEEYVAENGTLDLASIALTIDGVSLRAQFSSETGWTVALRG